MVSPSATGREIRDTAVGAGCQARLKDKPSKRAVPQPGGGPIDPIDEREAARRQDRFLATLAHELRNPLAPILTGLAVIRASASDPVIVRQVAGMMERATGQIVHMIDDLLDVMWMKTGKIALTRTRVPLGGILRNAANAARVVFQEHGHRIHLDPGPAGMQAEVDAERIEQVVLNLLLHAAKDTPRGGTIRLAWGVDESTAPWISVGDTGQGIDLSQHEKIFQRFEQSECGEQDGLGIGLALVKVIVELHGGSIVLNSGGPGTGSQFVVHLPADGPAAGQAAAVAPQERLEEGSAFRQVLVVDDGKTTADILAMFFEVEGYQVRVAYDGLQALEKVGESMPDVILMDLGMPRMDGFEAARRIREMAGGGGVVMVALSGWGQEKDKQRSAEAGFDDHLVKPVSPADLRVLLTRLSKIRSEGD